MNAKQSQQPNASLEGTLAALAQLLRTRNPSNGGDPSQSYAAQLMAKGPDAILKKVGEEATEMVLAAKNLEHGGAHAALIYETADLWFHSMVALSYFDCSPQDVIQELQRRTGISGLQEKATRTTHPAIDADNG